MTKLKRKLEIKTKLIKGNDSGQADQNLIICERGDKGAMARGRGYSWEQKVSSGTLSQTRDRRDIEISWTVYYEGSRLADKVDYCGIYT